MKKAVMVVEKSSEFQYRAVIVYRNKRQVFSDLHVDQMDAVNQALFFGDRLNYCVTRIEFNTGDK